MFKKTHALFLVAALALSASGMSAMADEYGNQQGAEQHQSEGKPKKKKKKKSGKKGSKKKKSSAAPAQGT